MIIYLEGPDGSGKSTLANTLAKELSEIYQVDANAENKISTHPTRPNRINEENLYKSLINMANSDKVYIMDRGPISDIVYRVFDKYKSVTTLTKFMKFLRMYDDKIFVIYCNSKDAEKNMLKRGDDNPIAIQHHKEISSVYDITMKQIKKYIPKCYHEYDYSSNDLSINTLLGNVNHFCSK